MSKEIQRPKIGLRAEQDTLDATILLVDDEPANVKLLARSLGNNGYRNLISTTEPRDVLELFLKHDIDLIILDLNMPHLDGFGVMQLLQNLGRDDLSAHPDPDGPV